MLLCLQGAGAVDAVPPRSHHFQGRLDEIGHMNTCKSRRRAGRGERLDGVGERRVRGAGASDGEGQP